MTIRSRILRLRKVPRFTALHNNGRACTSARCKSRGEHTPLPQGPTARWRDRLLLVYGCGRRAHLVRTIELVCYRGHFQVPRPLSKIIALALAGSSILGCGRRETRFESVCQLIRRDVVQEDNNGSPLILDVELEWDPCPGDQFQVVRGGKDFANCMRRYEVGKLVPVLVKHWWDDRGYYAWDVYQIGDCKREIEPEAEGSYEKSQECSDHLNFGKRTGFDCNRRPFRALVDTCPFLAR